MNTAFALQSLKVSKIVPSKHSGESTSGEEHSMSKGMELHKFRTWGTYLKSGEVWLEHGGE
jgi:hypothetical protein